MVSEKQLIANQQNAKLGGVKTPEGKAISKMNALKHGLLTKEVLLEGESEGALIELGRAIRKELKPLGELELLLVERIISGFWRLKRALRVERAMMEYENLWAKKAFLEEEEMAYTYEKLPKKDREELSNARMIRNTIVNDGTERLLRYETTIERQIYKALHELIRLQMARKGQKPPAPLAVDVDITGGTKDGFVS